MSAMKDAAKAIFGLLMASAAIFYAIVAPRNAKDTPSAIDPAISEWDFAWPIEAWNIGWMVMYNIIPGFSMMLVGPLAKYKEGIDHVLFFYRAWLFHVCWTIGGGVLLFNTKDTIAVAAPQIWNRGFRSWWMMTSVLGFIVVFGLIASIYVLFALPASEERDETEALDEKTKLARYIEAHPGLQKMLGEKQAASMPADAKV